MHATGFIHDSAGLTRYELDITILERREGRGKKTPTNWVYIAECIEWIPETPHKEIRGTKRFARRKFRAGEEYDSIKVIRK